MAAIRPAIRHAIRPAVYSPFVNLYGGGYPYSGEFSYAWIDLFPQIAVFDFENDKVLLRETTLAASFLGTFAEAVASKGVTDLTGGDYSIPASIIPGFNSANPRSVFAEHDPPSALQASVWDLSDGTSAENSYVRARGSSVNDYQFGMLDGGVSQASLVTTGLSAARRKSFTAIATNDISYVISGGTPLTDAAATLPTVTTLRNRRRYDGSSTLNRNTNNVYMIAVIPSRVSNADMQTYTT